MSKIIRVPNGDIKLSVSESGSITLDSELSGGTVGVKTGEFVVQGDHTAIDTTNTDFFDNIITVNNQGFDTEDPSDQGQAGFRVNINNDDSAFVVFDKQIEFTSPKIDYAGTGGVAIKYGLDPKELLGLRTNSVSSYDTDLWFETPELLRVIDSNEGEDYLDKINNVKLAESGNYTFINYVESGYLYVVANTEYANSQSIIPNIAYVDQEIEKAKSEVIDEEAYQIQKGSNSKSRVVTKSSDFGDDDKVAFEVENELVAEMKLNSFEFNGFRIESDQDNLTTDTVVESTRPGRDLVLRASYFALNNYGSVRVDDVFELSGELSQTAIDGIAAPGTGVSENTNGVKVYASAPGPGDTGIFYVNSEDTRDELVGKQKALFMSMIF